MKRYQWWHWAKFCSNDNNDDKDDGEGLLKQSFVNVRGWRNRCSYLSSLSHLSWSSMMIIVNEKTFQSTTTLPHWWWWWLWRNHNTTECLAAPTYIFGPSALMFKSAAYRAPPARKWPLSIFTPPVFRFQIIFISINKIVKIFAFIVILFCFCISSLVHLTMTGRNGKMVPSANWSPYSNYQNNINTSIVIMIMIYIFIAIINIYKSTLACWLCV